MPSRRFSTGGGLASAVAGAGLTLTGQVLAVGAGTGITVAADTVSVDQSFAPTWTGAHTFQAVTALTQPTSVTGSPSILTITGGANSTGFTAGAEAIDVSLALNRTVSF